MSGGSLNIPAPTGGARSAGTASSSRPAGAAQPRQFTSQKVDLKSLMARSAAEPRPSWAPEGAMYDPSVNAWFAQTPDPNTNTTAIHWLGTGTGLQGNRGSASNLLGGLIGGSRSPAGPAIQGPEAFGVNVPSFGGGGGRGPAQLNPMLNPFQLFLPQGRRVQPSGMPPPFVPPTIGGPQA